MKLYLAVLVFALLPVALFSRDIATLSGTIYKDVKICESNPIELIISFQDQDNPELTIMKSIPFTDLPYEIRKEFKYDPLKAEVFEKAIKEAMKQKAEDIKEQKAEDKMEKEAKEASPGMLDNQAGAAVNKDPVVSKTAPGEKNYTEEVKKIKEEASAVGIAPGEKNDAAEVNKMREEAAAKGIAPGEKNGPEEANKMRDEVK
ncbi:MAG TPA: hypothetical protein DCZ94_05660 [Lentisphaeria bacterium]|nr:MAG: hypothetical protein A2X48_07180 [Lentisphaerae bacterium GWF2_49_21]HBC86421.1 hypothetical protein [Lentisphaeria bacterium]